MSEAFPTAAPPAFAEPTASPAELTHREPGPQPRGAAATGASAKLTVTPRAGRDRYIDSLRALALVRVVTFHLFGWLWLPIVFPSMGIMFALAGSLLAASLDREQRHYAHVLGRRLRRLLPPLWAMGIIVVPIMFFVGWSTTQGETPLRPSSLFAWVVPLWAPPGSEAGHDWVVPLWYISTYLWLVLLSPPLLWLFRRWPKRIAAAPLLILLAITASIIRPQGAALGDALIAVCTYASCWMIGFAHHDGSLRAVPMWKVVVAALGLAAVGLWWTFRFPDPELGASISDIPVASAFYNLGAVLLLLRLYLDFSWMAKIRWLDALVGAINQRAVTVYLWGNIAIYLALAGLAAWPVTTDLVDDSAQGRLIMFAATWIVIGGFVLALGWVEDVAARRAPRLLPRGRQVRAPRNLRRE